MGKPTELMQLLKTGNSDAARKLIAKMKKSGKYRAASEKQPFNIKKKVLFIYMCTLNRLVQLFACVYELRERKNHDRRLDIVRASALFPCCVQFNG
jgi:hypothetical protein